jgi:hypothetical protein
LLLEQEGAALFNVELSTHECGGRVVVGLSGELDGADAVSVAASLAAIAAGYPQVIIALAGGRPPPETPGPGAAGKNTGKPAQRPSWQCCPPEVRIFTSRRRRRRLSLIAARSLA